MSDGTTPTDNRLLVACLCARWCGTCNEYAPLFAQLRTIYPGADFQWIDIEDESDLVDPVEVDDFPTILIATGREARFFGSVTPHLETLRRLIDSYAAPGTGHADVAVHALTGRLLARRTGQVRVFR